MRIIDSIIIHCADTREDDPKTLRNEEMDIGVKEIEEWHRERGKTEKWSWYKDENGQTKYIGYHFVVRRNGAIEVGRPVTIDGCHTKGMNKQSIGICWVGRNSMSDNQKLALIQLTARMCVLYALSAIDVYGHDQFSQKTCPNFNSEHTFTSIHDFRNEVEMAIRDIK